MAPLLVAGFEKKRPGRRVENPPGSSDYVGIVPIIEEQMSPRLWDLGDDARQELESIDFFEPREELARVFRNGNSWKFGGRKRVSA